MYIYFLAITLCSLRDSYNINLPAALISIFVYFMKIYYYYFFTFLLADDIEFRVSFIEVYRLFEDTKQSCDMVYNRYKFDYILHFLFLHFPSLERIAPVLLGELSMNSPRRDEMNFSY